MKPTMGAPTWFNPFVTNRPARHSTEAKSGELICDDVPFCASPARASTLPTSSFIPGRAGALSRRPAATGCGIGRGARYGLVWGSVDHHLVQGLALVWSKRWERGLRLHPAHRRVEVRHQRARRLRNTADGDESGQGHRVGIVTRAEVGQVKGDRCWRRCRGRWRLGRGGGW
mgnify:CR=1 FL=1